jgi:hypothetical protein
LSQHVAGSRLASNINITLKITFTSEIFADITRSLAVVLQHLKFCKKILILIFFLDLFSVECKFFCPNSADNTMENRAISLVESSRDNSLIACRTWSYLLCGTPEQHHSGTRNTRTLKILNLLKIKKKNTGGVEL